MVPGSTAPGGGGAGAPLVYIPGVPNDIILTILRNTMLIVEFNRLYLFLQYF